MIAKLESVLVVTTPKGEVVAIVRRDPELKKQVFLMTQDAKVDDIAAVINGTIEETPV